MRLDRLEIHGFKSFSDRSELAFDKGVTAIVGPNGCGKSNVADAITWVMGEQSAKSLRGERMEDVIFSGSDGRKPTAAAEVRLRFSGVLQTLTGPAFPAEQRTAAGAHANGRDGHGNGNGNSHHAFPESDVQGNTAALAVAPTEELIQSVARDVEVTRRLYRSGESEYLIDGQICRLKDIHDLLMDTGLGAKAYAIIEQGKIGMILSSRPTDRRQLIEEAAGVTKYKSRRRSAELKLEAAQLNLTRIDDIVFEVEKQCGTLKRQAAKAQRYQKLRDEVRRWEKVLFARKYRQLAETIESARGRLSEARDRELAAGARLAHVESDLGRVRIQLVEAEGEATRARELAHARELAINRQQQQIAFDREQVSALETRTTVVAAEVEVIEARREPARVMVASRREALAVAVAERERAAATLTIDSETYESAHREIEGLEADVEGARSEVFSAINSATALRHALEHAAAASDRVAETLSKLDVEADDVRIEQSRTEAERSTATAGLAGAHEAIEATRIARSARESELASARSEHESRVRSVRAGEHELAGLEARLKSLEELQAARAGYGDAPRMVLAEANGKVNQQGAIADYLEVETGYERAVEACLGDLLQHVIVEHSEHAAAGFQVVRDAEAGRCGFVIASRTATTEPNNHFASGVADVDGVPIHSPDVTRAALNPTELSALEPASAFGQSMPGGIIGLSSVVRVGGRFAVPIQAAIGEAWIADSYAGAQDASTLTAHPVVTMDGHVFRGPNVVSGGGREDARGILETKREIKELRERSQIDRAALSRLVQQAADLEATIAQLSNAIAALDAEQHKQEKVIVGHEAQLQHSIEEGARLDHRTGQLARERRQAEDERDSLRRRQEEARASIERIETEQLAADGRLTTAQRRLFEAREAAEDLSQRAADARAAHAGLVERAGALGFEVERLEEAAADLQARAAALSMELHESRRRAEELRAAVVTGESQLAIDIQILDGLQTDVHAAEDAVSALRIASDEHEAAIKVARGALESIRAVVVELDIARATAEADLGHLAAACVDTVQTTLDAVAAEVEQLERNGALTPDARVICAEEVEEDGDGGSRPSPVASAGDPSPSTGDDSAQRTLSAEEAIAHLRTKIERLGAVNMMAIEQFDELETRHAFLTMQRKDLIESIAQTSEAITRIDETTRQRFADAFAVINRNFQETFSTLFGGGRAGLTLLDENDPLESGIEIIAQPPGKRLQSVQLLSGGEKALTAIALMFGMFKYKPSPFCLLDEIDAPLDDANIGRFVEMLRGMQQLTQFIVITHNRKTMEIADRLYGVTMEEPGVSKLISVQLH